MAKKTKAKKSTVEKDLRAKLKKVRAQLSVAEKSAEKWKHRARKQQKDAASLTSELTAVRRRAAKAESAAEKWKGRATSAGTTPAAAPKAEAPKAEAPKAAAPKAAAPAPAAPAASSQAASPGRATTPDDSWTVTALRAEARSRGVAGYSRKTKAQLLADLRG